MTTTHMSIFHARDIHGYPGNILISQPSRSWLPAAEPRSQTAFCRYPPGGFREMSVWRFAGWAVDQPGLFSRLNLYSPICSMYGIFTYIYPKNHPNVGKYSIHGASGNDSSFWETQNITFTNEHRWSCFLFCVRLSKGTISILIPSH